MLTGLTDLERSLLIALAEECASSYKMPFDDILSLISSELRLPRCAELRKSAAAAKTLPKALRLSEWRDFRKWIRSSLYQTLRRYKSAEQEMDVWASQLQNCEDLVQIGELAEKLLLGHISSKERLPYKEDFARLLKEAAKPGYVVADIGCGLNPLMLPLEFYESLSLYMAVDKDPKAVETINLFAQKMSVKNLCAFRWDISTGVDELKSLTGILSFDLALVLKVIPVVARADQRHGAEEPKSLPVLGNFPAKTMLATASRESMSKRESIEKRELGVLRRFIKSYGYKTVSEFSCGDEFGFLLEKAF
jgi:16S rRNA (guanine(1405)-N(7))-methyltransferase